MNHLSNGRFAAKVTSHSKFEMRKTMEFPVLLLAKSCLPHIDTLEQKSNE